MPGALILTFPDFRSVPSTMLATGVPTPMCSAISADEHSRSGLLRKNAMMRSLALPFFGIPDVTVGDSGTALFRPFLFPFFRVRLADAAGETALMCAGYHSDKPHP